MKLFIQSGIKITEEGMKEFVNNSEEWTLLQMIAKNLKETYRIIIKSSKHIKRLDFHRYLSVKLE